MNELENSKTPKEEQQMKQIHAHVLDLTQIDGDGEFLCPECENRISPDDCAEEGYSILEIKLETQSLDEVIIQCNKCTTTIHLTGFSLLQKFSGIEIEKRESKKEEKDPCYVIHV
jgi:hypothetical protein